MQILFLFIYFYSFQCFYLIFSSILSSIYIFFHLFKICGKFWGMFCEIFCAIFCVCRFCVILLIIKSKCMMMMKRCILLFCCFMYFPSTCPIYFYLWLPEYSFTAHSKLAWTWNKIIVNLSIVTLKTFSVFLYVPDTFWQRML